MTESKKKGSNSLHNVYRRPAWKNITRWLAFIMIIVLDSALIGSSVRSHQSLGVLLSVKELLSYLIILLLNALVIPSIVFEIDSIVIESDGMIFKNLLFSTKEKWENLISVYSPIYLKFAILRGSKFIYLINKRDLGNFDELMKTIYQKAKNLK
jgi:hypothetical protein